VYIGEEVEPTAAFFEDGVVITPVNPSLYPNYIVRDPDGDMLTAGVGSLDDTDNLYHALFTVPSEALLSKDDSKYVIEWEMVSLTGKEYKVVEHFDVASVSYDDSREQQRITLSVTPLMLTLPVVDTADSIEVRLYDPLQTQIWSGVPLKKGIYDKYSVYSIVIPAGTMKQNNEYIAVWEYSSGSQPPATFVQKIYCVDLFTLSQTSDLRMYLDKVSKDIDLYTGYRESDLYFYMVNGLRHINMITPITTWTSVSFKGDLSMALFAWHQGAAYCALRSQYLAEGDSAFDYSGSPVSLSVDRTQYIESELGRIQEWLNGEFKEFKKHWKNRNYGFVLGTTMPTVSNFYRGKSLTYKGIPRFTFNR
jgi:hypothetical protein